MGSGRSRGLGIEPNASLALAMLCLICCAKPVPDRVMSSPRSQKLLKTRSCSVRIVSGRSFSYTENNTGLRLSPWATPVVRTPYPSTNERVDGSSKPRSLAALACRDTNSALEMCGTEKPQQTGDRTVSSCDNLWSSIISKLAESETPARRLGGINDECENQLST